MSKWSMVRRYFEITEVDGRTPKTYVEYFNGFGAWIYTSKIYRWEYIDKQKQQHWLISSDLVTDYHHVILDLKGRVLQKWQPINLEAVSNPKSSRLPAMSRKAKK